MKPTAPAAVPAFAASAVPAPAAVLAHAPGRRRFVRTTAGGIVVAALPLAGCAPFAAVPDSAVAAWRPDERRDDPRRWALSWAILAPNPHNRQPWLVDLSEPGEILVRIDTTRLLPETDPFGRQILIGAGAMLGLLEIAAASLSLRTDVRLLEDGPYGERLDGRPLARIRLVADATAGRGDAATLFAQIPARRTVRLPYERARPVAAGDARAFEAAGGDGITAGVLDRTRDAGRVDAIAAIAKAAWKIELTTPRLVMESVNLLRVGSAEIDRYRDGITLASPMLVVLDRIGLLDRSTAPAPDAAITRRQLADFDTAIDSTPAFYWLATTGNTRREQIAAGVAYAKAQLRATALGLVMQPVSQSLQEYPEMDALRRDVHRVLATGGTTQMLCRIGYLPDGVAMPGPSPRRGLAAHLAA
ncbi:MAG: twin-arginine translocation pathway signal protein [Lautropia sp.]